MTQIPDWLYVALGEIGISERAGKRDNPRIREYHAAARGATHDEVPWCSAFVNWCMREAGIAGTNSKRARSWLDWGVPLQHYRIGSVAVLWREKPDGPKGHVGFFLAQNEGRVWLLGGNQGNRVSVAGYPLRRVLGYRWPA